MSVTTPGGRPVVEVTGEVDLASSPALRQAIASQIESGHTELILDLGEVTFMDSSGLNVLAGAARRLGPKGVLIAGCRPNIRRLFELSGLGAVFRMYESVEAAMNDVS